MDPANTAAQNELFNSAKNTMTTAQFIDYVKKNSNGADTSGMLYDYALKLHKEGKLADAILLYKEVLPKDTTGEIYTNLAIAQGQMKDFNTAIATLNNAKTKFPNNSEILTAIKSINDEAIGTQLNKAADFFNNNDYKNAIAEYQKIQPATVDSMLGIASAYQNLDDYPNAIEYYKKALELKPTDTDIAYYIGALYSDMGNYSEAESYLNKAVSLNKTNQNAIDLLASIKEQNNSIALDNAIKLYDEQKYDESLDLLNKVLSYNNQNAYALYYRGMIYDAKKKLYEAITDFKKALNLNASDFTILNYMIASDYDTLGKYKEAYSYYTEYAAANVPDDEYKQYAKSRAEELKQYAGK